jgi:hypothetical protein
MCPELLEHVFRRDVEAYSSMKERILLKLDGNLNLESSVNLKFFSTKDSQRNKEQLQSFWKTR